MVTGAPVPEAATSGGKIEVTTTITDTGERKQLFGYQAWHLKSKVVEESSADACSKLHHTFEVDGWYADVGKELAGCTSMAPPVHQTQGCQDSIVEQHSGAGKPGYPLTQNVIMHNLDGSTMTVSINVTDLAKQPLDAALFDVPAGYKQVNSFAELQGIPQVPAVAQQVAAQNGGPSATPLLGMQNMAAMMHQGGGNQPASTPIAAPQALGPKAAGKIRIGVAPPEAQLGQGNNAGADYSTPIRNAIVLL
jgi:hypothetical protein